MYAKIREAYAVAAKVGLIGVWSPLVVVVAYAVVISLFGQPGTIQYYFDPAHPDTPAWWTPPP